MDKDINQIIDFKKLSKQNITFGYAKPAVANRFETVKKEQENASKRKDVDWSNIRKYSFTI